MIKTQNLVPEIFYKYSRDFQVLGRTYDFIFNYLKLNTETLENFPYSNLIDTNLIDLVTTTLGFKKIHEYNIKQLSALCSIFTLALRNKGNIQSIYYLLNLLGNIENTTNRLEVFEDKDDPYKLDIYIPIDVKDITLFEDVLDYILPAGMSYVIIRSTLIDATPIKDKYVLITPEVIKGNPTNIFKTGQALQVDENAKQMAPADIEYGRIDNTIIAAFDGTRESSEIEKTLQENIKESQYETQTEGEEGQE